MESALVLGAVVAYLALGFAWPTLRLWRRHGVWPVVFSRKASPGQRALGWLSGGLFLVLLGTSTGRLLFGAQSLDIAGSPRIAQGIGWVLFLGGALLTLVAQRQMGASWRVGIDDRPTGLITLGVFRWVRNPIFTGVLLALAGYACWMPAWWSLALWALTAVGLRVQIAHEERHLARLHGAAYLSYAARVGRLLPCVGRLRSPVPDQNHGRS
jgi:protein-S-isoprenylcysteine O-methyltransferase Ste14